MKKLYLLLFIAVFLNACSEEDTAPKGSYFPKVKTIIAANCLSCHSSSGSWQGRPTALDTDEQIVAAAASIKASVADPITPRNKRMPEGSTLSQADIDTIVAWYNAGGTTKN